MASKTSYVAVPLTLGSGRESAVAVRADVVEYFGIEGGQSVGTGLISRTRAAHSRSIIKEGLQDATPETVTVERAEWFDPPRILGGSGGGKAIIVPTEITIAPPSGSTKKPRLRTVTFRFPGSATNGIISVWLFEKCVSNKPGWFRVESGTRYAVVARGATADVNPGNQNPAPAA